MSGRTENDIKNDDIIRERLKICPMIMSEYYYSFTRKTKSTQKAYIYYVSDFLFYLRDELHIDIDDVEAISKVRQFDINIYMDKIKKKKRGDISSDAKESIRACRLAAITNFYNFLVYNNYCKVNPCSRIESPVVSDEKDVVYMDKNEIRIMTNNIKNGVGSHKSQSRHSAWKNRDMAIVELGCTTGLRVTAITEIDIGDINFDTNSIHVIEKNKRGRDIYINENIMSSIKVWMNDRKELMRGYPNTDALFIGSRRTRITSKSVWEMIRKYSVGINKHITPHKMRSTCATNLYVLSDGDIYLVKDQLGHKNIANTQKYTNIPLEDKIKAANLLGSMFD